LIWIKEPRRAPRHARRTVSRPEGDVAIEASDIVVGVMVAVLGLLGLTAAAHAHDNEMYVFGLGLAGFAGAFVIGQIRRHYDRAEAARRELHAGATAP
jgi:hypothetical protein